MEEGRLKSVRQSLGMNQEEFAKSIGLQQGSYSSIESGRGKSNLTSQTEILLRVIHHVNIDYLYGNSEEMFTNGIKEASIEAKPRIPYDAAAGTLTETVEGVCVQECEMIPVVSIFPSYDFTIRITGDSMEPEYHSGDEVACKRINEKSFIQWGRVHVLDTTQGVVIKRIYEDGGYIKCCSYNKEYPDFSIPKSEIRSYNLVVGSLRL